MGFSKLTDMARSDEEKGERVREMMGSPMINVPDYPPELSICLNEETLEKLDIDDDCEIGDMIDLRAMAKVTSVSKHQVDGKDKCRIELQITHLAVENEDDEEPGED